MAVLEELLSQMDALRASGKLPSGVTREERISWVYGNCKLSNPLITREMVEAAVDGAGVRAVALDAVERADKPLGAPEVSPAVQAAFAAGRQAGLQEAAAMMREAAKRLDDGDPDAIDRLMATTFRSCAESLEFDAAGAQ